MKRALSFVFLVSISICSESRASTLSNCVDCINSDIFQSLILQLTQLTDRVNTLDEVVQTQRSIIARHEGTIDDQTIQLKELSQRVNEQGETGQEIQKQLDVKFITAEEKNGRKNALTEIDNNSVNSNKEASGGVKSNTNDNTADNGEKRFLEIPGERANKVAFSAYLSHDIDAMNGNQTIVFDSLVLNEGSGYNQQSGLFTAPIPGVYLVSFAVNTYKDLPLWVNLVVNGELKSNVIVWPHFNPSANMQGSNVVLLRLNKGDNVWVLIDEQGYGTSVHGGNTYRVTTFSGVFLYD